MARGQSQTPKSSTYIQLPKIKSPEAQVFSQVHVVLGWGTLSSERCIPFGLDFLHGQLGYWRSRIFFLVWFMFGSIWGLDEDILGYDTMVFPSGWHCLTNWKCLIFAIILQFTKILQKKLFDRPVCLNLMPEMHVSSAAALGDKGDKAFLVLSQSTSNEFTRDEPVVIFAKVYVMMLTFYQFQNKETKIVGILRDM
ncbi:hypothetical protein DFJ58DRAFT_846835 [Suillus subalutaceus]|uniref:uncharacterized protein n=1 Tax=Suillus subalutaceus TaxID=48586 RepID=UPI001B877115|nr:uncharacterized protein DFJ58DRAFT_846835 [Suillus subalutaceus]KAG1836685.1 hypothetical protein DFJ58DRAFT_846835 [Suillus subalutaceus]